MKKEFSSLLVYVANCFNKFKAPEPNIVKKYISNLSYEEVIDFIKSEQNDFEENIKVTIIISDERFQNTKAIKDLIELYKKSMLKKETLLGIIKILFFYKEDLKKNGNPINFDDIDENSIIEEIKKAFRDSPEDIYAFLDEGEQTDELFERKINKNIKIETWKETKKQTPSKLSFLLDSIYNEEGYEKKDKILIIWSDTHNKSEELLSVILNSSVYNKIEERSIKSSFINRLLNVTSPDNKDAFEMLLNEYFYNTKEFNEDEIAKMKEKMYNLIKISPYTYEEIDLRILEFEFINFDQLFMLCTDKSRQYDITEFIEYNTDADKEVLKIIIQRILENSTNWKKNIDAFFYTGQQQNRGYYYGYAYSSLLSDINKHRYDINFDIMIDIFIKIALKDPFNVFDIKSVDEMLNYRQIRFKICTMIMEGKDVELDAFSLYNCRPELYIREKDRKKFAYLELKYGISLDIAENLIKKYGVDINSLSPENNEELKIIRLVNEIKKILTSDNSSVDLKDNFDGTDLDIMEIEDILSKMYLRTFQNKINTTNPSKMYSIKYDGKNPDLQGNIITIEEYSPFIENENGNISFSYTEIGFLIRQEGGYTSWVEPKDYNEFYNEGSLYKRKFNVIYISISSCSFRWKRRTESWI